MTDTYRADVEWQQNWKLLPYVPDSVPGRDHFHYGGVAAGESYIMSMLDHVLTWLQCIDSRRKRLPASLEAW